jgi:hypothetical protein
MRRLPAFALAFMLVLLAPPALAVTTVDTQKNITVNLEQGEEYSFNLILKNITARIDVTTGGNASAWVTYGEGHTDTYTITNLVDQTLKVTVFVPSSAETKNYEAVIKGNEDTISTIYIGVTEAFGESFEDLQTEVTRLKKEISDLRSQQGEMQSRLNEVKAGQKETGEKTDIVEDLVKGIDDKLNTIQSFQDDLRLWREDYEKQREEMQVRIDEMEEKNKELTELTGALSIQGTSLTLLLIVIVAGLLFYALSSVNRRGRLAGKIARRFRLSGHGSRQHSQKLPVRPGSGPSERDSAGKISGGFSRQRFTESDFRYKYHPK